MDCNKAKKAIETTSKSHCATLPAHCGICEILEFLTLSPITNMSIQSIRIAIRMAYIAVIYTIHMQKIQSVEERISPATGTAYTRLISFLAPSTHARNESQNRERRQ